MDLDPRSSADLADFFAKRFPLPEQRDTLASEAHVRFHEPTSEDASVAWGGLLTRAQEQEALERLARCAARRIPDDENLQGVSAVLNGRAWPPPPVVAAPPTRLRQVSVMAALVTLAIGAVWLGRGGPAPATAAVSPAAPEAMSATPVASAAESAPLAAPAPDAPASEPAPTLAPPAPEAEAPALAAASGTTDEGDADTAPSSAPARSAHSPQEATAATTAPRQLPGCRGEPGELVGYWYAGPTAPGKTGDRITVPRDLNVRADYPDQHNNFNARAQVRCTLGQGADLVLTADPIAVPGGAYWVPLHTPSSRS